MDIEKAEHINILTVAIVFLLFLTFVIDHFLNNIMLSFSIGIVTASFALMLLLFQQIIGAALLTFMLVFVFLSVIFSNILSGFFAASLVMGVLVLFTLLTR